MLFDPNWQQPKSDPLPIEPWQQMLLNAADLIERVGWTQGTYHDHRGYCAVGALRSVGFWDDETKRQARNKLAAHIGTWFIPLWNDKDYRTKTEVVAAFRKAADVNYQPLPGQIVINSSSWTGR